MVDKANKAALEIFLKKHNLEYKLVIADVSNAIKEQHDFSAHNNKPIENLNDFDYSKYHTLDEINDWIDQIAQQYSKYISVFNVTQSFEKRNLKAFKISIPSSTLKKAMWFDGGIHA